MASAGTGHGIGGRRGAAPALTGSEGPRACELAEPSPCFRATPSGSPWASAAPDDGAGTSCRSILSGGPAPVLPKARAQ